MVLDSGMAEWRVRPRMPADGVGRRAPGVPLLAG